LINKGKGEFKYGMDCPKCKGALNCEQAIWDSVIGYEYYCSACDMTWHEVWKPDYWERMID